MFGSRPRAGEYARTQEYIVAHRLTMTDPSGSRPDDREEELRELAL